MGDWDTGRIRYRKTAMSIGGHNVFGEVTGREWRKLARVAQQDDDKVFGYVRQLASRMPDAVRDAINELPQDVQGYQVLIDRLLSRVAALAKHTLATLGDMDPQQAPVRINPLGL